MSKRPLLAVFLVGVALAAGCTTQVFYGGPTDVETLTDEWGSTDIQGVTNRMVQSLVSHPVISQGNRPIVYVSRLRNKTMEHIDTKSVTDKIRTALLKTGLVRFTAASDAEGELSEQIEYQNKSGAVDPRYAKLLGKQYAADFLLYGEIASIVKRSGRDTDVYYKITLNLVEIETGLIQWADEKEIRKQSRRPLLGP